jgi:hypothetical protein
MFLYSVHLQHIVISSSLITPSKSFKYSNTSFNPSLVNEVPQVNQFSYEGLGLLFEHLSNDEDCEFDKIGICCDWTEYKNIEAARKEYRVGVDGHCISLVVVPISAPKSPELTGLVLG